MAETIRADQIEGLTELIRDQVRTVIQVESRPDLQNVDEVRRSPAGTLIRLEGKIDGLKVEMDQRFQAVDQRIESLADKMEQRFQVVNQRIESLEDKMDHRFDDQDRRFKLFQWVMILMFSLLIAMAGKLFSM